MWLVWVPGLLFYGNIKKRQLYESLNNAALQS